MYAELHCHSAFSFLDGASLPEELVARAKQLNMTALALTDHDGLYGSMAFAQAAKACGIQPITGAEVTVEGIEELEGDAESEGGAHLTLLVETAEGYANLCRLLSHAHLGNPKGEPRVSWEQLRRHHLGLIVLTGCRHGEIPRLVDAGRLDTAYDAACRYRDVFGRENVWIELQQNFVKGDTARIGHLVDLARRLDLGVVATNNVHYHVRERHRLQDVLVAIKHRTTLNACHRQRRANSEFYMKSPAEMAALFAELPEAIRATREISERCAQFDLTADLGYSFPNFEVRPASEGNLRRSKGGGTAERSAAGRSEAGHEGERDSADRHLARVCGELLARRYQDEPPALRRQAEVRLERELDLVRYHKLSGFFLVYRDLMNLADQVADEVRGPSSARQAAHLPPGRGRGSSVSSLICYLVGLSHVDPIRNGLSIDRFLTKELQSVPDIDLDFPRDLREALIRRVYEHYGQEHAALVCSFATYRFRSAVRDVGKALGLPLADLEKLIKLSEAGSSKDIRAAVERIPELAERLESPLWQHFVKLVEDISGFPRHITQHVGGMVISSRPLVEIVPMEKARMPGRFVCQWDKDSCEDARFIKVDFLGLGMLSLVEECVELIAENRGETVDLSRIPFDDASVYDQICSGDTVGVFQIESRAQIQLLPRTRPRSLEELAIEVAIIRPGPIVGGAVHPYVTRRMEQREAAKRGEPYEPPYDHPLLKSALAETLGVILYQDQVLQAAVDLAGFTPGQADSLRRALGRKRSKEAVLQLRNQFRAGARRKGVATEVADTVFEKILAFSLFGFPKSHSYAFAVLAYQSAWLRRYYPSEYTAALFNSQPMGFYPPHVLVRDAQRHGVRVLPPHINFSGKKCTVNGGVVRIGFNYVKGLGGQAATRIVEERDRAGLFTSLDDFVQRVDLSRKRLEGLITAGAFDGFRRARRELLWDLGLTMRSKEMRGEMERGKERTSSPSSSSPQTFRQPPLSLRYPNPPVHLPKMNEWDVVASDYAATRLSTRKHLLALLRPRIPRRFITVKQMGTRRDGTTTHLAGLVVARQRPETAAGVLFMLLEDETGMANVIVRPTLYEKRRSVIRGEQMLAVYGKVQRRDGTLNLVAYDVSPLSKWIDIPDVEQLRRKAPSSHDFR